MKGTRRVTIFVEGGGKDRLADIECRAGFRKLFERAGFKGQMPAVQPCGGRDDARKAFEKACCTFGSDNLPVLLVDSEAPIPEGASPRAHLKARDGWEFPEVYDDQVQLMVQCMETWCVADPKSLGNFFGQDFSETALPKHRNLEAVAKDDVQAKLEKATSQCGKKRKGEIGKRAYTKGKRSFDVLAALDPQVLKDKLPHFRQLCDMLAHRLSDPE